MIMRANLNFQLFFKSVIAVGLSVSAFVGCATTDDRSLSGQEPRPRTYPQLISRKVTDEWNLEVKNQTDLLRVETARVPGNRLTVGVMVAISEDGTVQGVRVAKSSGVRTMDELAMLTFHRVSPLPPPPVRAIRNGSLQLPWDFNLNK